RPAGDRAYARSRRPPWRGVGARASRSPKKAQAKASRYLRALFQKPRVFLSQAGPRFRLDLLQAEHHLCMWTLVLGKTKGDPPGPPRLACYAARNLARKPPSEGKPMATRIPTDAADSAERIRPEPARRDRCGRSRFGHGEWVGERRLHESPQVSVRRI